MFRRQRGEYDLAERSAMRRSYRACAVGQLEGALSASTCQHDDGIPLAHRKMRALTGLARKLLKDRGRQAYHLHLVESAGGERKSRTANAIAFRIFHLAHIAE